MCYRLCNIIIVVLIAEEDEMETTGCDTHIPNADQADQVHTRGNNEPQPTRRHLQPVMNY